jgi:hypothetical protein
MARNYITAIRTYDFSKTDTPTNNQYVLADGYVQAKPKDQGGGFSQNSWHPDYSDIRAYQLFQIYDDDDVFWDKVITATISCWKAIFYFGSKDTRVGQGGALAPIDAANTWVQLSNPVYEKLEASSEYAKVKANRVNSPYDNDGQLYTTDSQRLPIRLLNYINGTNNGKDVDYGNIIGIANANLTALGTSYVRSNRDLANATLTNSVNITSLWPQDGKPYIQNYTAAGLLAYASNMNLSFSYMQFDRKSVYDSLNTKFGANGMGINPDDTQDGFNPSLTLWGLTVSNGGETPLQTHILTLAKSLGASAPTAAHDFNSDGRSDIIWRDGGGNTSVWLMNGATVLSPVAIGTVPTQWSIVGQRDFDGDGDADLLWRDTSGNTAIWFMNGTAVSSSAGIGNVANTSSVVATGDFDGDGLGDILWQDSSGNLAVWLMNGATVTSVGGIGNVPGTWAVVGTGDFNGDGMADILWRDNLGNISIWFMNGTTVGSTAGVGNTPTNWSVVGTGDFNGDGMTDIVWRDTAGDAAIWLMNGGAVSSAGTLGNVPTTWSIALVGDYNGDGLSDLHWRDTSGNTAIWFMNGMTVSSTGAVGNIPTSWIVQSVNAE